MRSFSGVLERSPFFHFQPVGAVAVLFWELVEGEHPSALSAVVGYS